MTAQVCVLIALQTVRSAGTLSVLACDALPTHLVGCDDVNQLQRALNQGHVELLGAHQLPAGTRITPPSEHDMLTMIRCLPLGILLLPVLMTVDRAEDGTLKQVALACACCLPTVDR